MPGQKIIYQWRIMAAPSCDLPVSAILGMMKGSRHWHCLKTLLVPPIIDHTDMIDAPDLLE
jgi:hypothetical protein